VIIGGTVGLITFTVSGNRAGVGIGVEEEVNVLTGTLNTRLGLDLK
jgi:hypothetical protein